MYNTSNYVNPDSALAMVIVFPILTALALAARLYSHYLNGERIQGNVDVYFAVASFIFVLACSISLGVAWSHKTFGYTSQRQAGFEGVSGIQILELITYLFTELWVVGITCVKACFLFFYRRLLGYGRLFRLCNTILIVSVFVWCLCFFFLNLLQCGSHFEDLDSTGKPSFKNPQCINVVTILFASSVSDCILDVAIILLPMPTIWALNMRPRTKVGVTAIFALGAFCIVVSALRLASWAALWLGVTHGRTTVTILGVNDDNDFGGLSTMLFWSQIELGVGSIVCNLPCIRPIITKSRVRQFLKVLRSKVSLSSLRARRLRSKQSSAKSSSTDQTALTRDIVPYGAEKSVAATAEKIGSREAHSGGEEGGSSNEEFQTEEFASGRNIIVHTNISTYTEPRAV